LVAAEAIVKDERGHGGRRVPGRRHLRPEPQIQVADVACAARDMAGLPLGANIATMSVMATKLPPSAAARLAGHHLLGPARPGRLLGRRRFGYGPEVKRTGLRARPEAPAVTAVDQE
jgi:hypothetical protein